MRPRKRLDHTDPLRALVPFPGKSDKQAAADREVERSKAMMLFMEVTAMILFMGGMAMMYLYLIHL